MIDEPFDNPHHGHDVSPEDGGPPAVEMKGAGVIPLFGPRVSFAAHVMEGREPTDAERAAWAEDPNPAPEGPAEDPLVAAGLVAAPTIDPPREPVKDEPAKRREVRAWTQQQMADTEWTALRSGSPQKRHAAVAMIVNQLRQVQMVCGQLLQERDTARLAFSKLAEYIGSDAAVAEALGVSLETTPDPSSVPAPAPEVAS